MTIHPRPLRCLPPLILASGSPRRRELLAEAGYDFTVVPPGEDVECGVCSESGPAGLVAELALRKAAAVVQQLQNDASAGRRAGSSATPVWRRPGSLPPSVLAADTLAECDGLVLGKPRNEDDARTMLKQLRGREHRVLTGVCLWPLASPIADETNRGAKQRERQPLVRVAVTRLRMDPLSDAQLDNYLASGQWEGKAGAFGYQDRLGWVHVAEGSETNVVGLPMELLEQMLDEIARDC